MDDYDLLGDFAKAFGAGADFVMVYIYIKQLNSLFRREINVVS